MAARALQPDDLCFQQLDLISSPVFVLEPSSDGLPRYVAFNKIARDITGRPLADFIGLTAQEVYGGAMGLTALQRHCEVAQSGRAITYELELPIKGRSHTVRTTLIPHANPGGGGYLLYGTSTDLTDLQSTREAQVKFDTIATEMEQFVAMAAHDLRAPMRNVGQIAEMLREDITGLDESNLRLIDMLEEISAKSMNLITDVLSHAHAVDIKETNGQFNFGALCRDICDVIDPQQNASFTYTSAEIIGDRTTFQIGVRNLIENAFKYSNREQLKIDIGLHRGRRGMLNVVVSDNGPGFPDAAVDFLNGGGFRADSGYGLLGVRRMVQARGGSVTAGNNPDGDGAVVRFSLPGQWVGLTRSLGDPPDNWSGPSGLTEPTLM